MSVYVCVLFVIINRTFLPEKLVIHNRSCTADKPARRVNESVNRGKTIDLEIPPPNTVPRPSTTSTPYPRLRKAASSMTLSKSTNGDDGDASENITNLKIENGKAVLAGPMGGSAGRQLRTNKASADIEASSSSSSPGSNEEVISAITERLDNLETAATSLITSVRDMKKLLKSLKL